MRVMCAVIAACCLDAHRILRQQVDWRCDRPLRNILAGAIIERPQHFGVATGVQRQDVQVGD
jgi:hypothetical protein